MKLSRLERKMIEEYWIHIDDYRKKLEFRYWELTEKKSDAENVGGGKSSGISDTTARKAMLLAEDEQYQHYKKIVEVITSMYTELETDLKTIVDMRYWDRDGVYEWEDIADKLYISRNKVLRLRNLLVDKTAERLGWV